CQHASHPLCSLSYSSFRLLLALHSFPTRRSSDLFYVYNTLVIAVREGARYASIKPYDSTTTTPTSAFQNAVRNMVVYGDQNPPGDRKSTRLNSSHGSISYAVFCLKKKSKHHTAEH